MKKLLFAVSAGAIGVALTGATAQAQWPGHHDPDYGYDYGHEYSTEYDYDRSHRSHGRYAPGWWGRDIGSASHELSERATHLAHLLRGMDGYSHLTDDAISLARRADQFHRVVSGRVTRDYVLSHFRAVQNEWQHFNEELSRAHHIHHVSHVVEDFAELRRAYAQVVQAIRRDWSRPTYYDSYDGHYGEPYRRGRVYERPYVRVKPEARIRLRARIY